MSEEKQNETHMNIEHEHHIDEENVQWQIPAIVGN